MNDTLENKSIKYEDLRQIIKDFYKNRFGINLSTISIDYLRHQLMNDNKNQLFFIINSEYGEKRFNLSKEEITLILKDYLAQSNSELVDLNFGYNIQYSFKSNSEIKNRVHEEIATSGIITDKSEIPFNGKIRYEDLRQIVFDFYEAVYGIHLDSISIGYLIDYLKNDRANQHFFIMNNNGEESRFTIPKDDIIRMMINHLSNQGYELISIDFKDLVEFKYTDSKGKKFNFAESVDEFNNEDNIIKDDSPSPQPESSSKNEESHATAKESPVEELARMARENRKFTILQRERAMTDAERARTRSAIMAGICILGAAVTTYFSGQDINQVLQNEVNAIYSWEALGQYMKDLGPLNTLLSAGAGAFIARYFRNSRRLRQARDEFIDFNDSLEVSETKNMRR